MHKRTKVLVRVLVAAGLVAVGASVVAIGRDDPDSKMVEVAAREILTEADVEYIWDELSREQRKWVLLERGWFDGNASYDGHMGYEDANSYADLISDEDRAQLEREGNLEQILRNCEQKEKTLPYAVFKAQERFMPSEEEMRVNGDVLRAMWGGG